MTESPDTSERQHRFNEAVAEAKRQCNEAIKKARDQYDQAEEEAYYQLENELGDSWCQCNHCVQVQKAAEGRLNKALEDAQSRCKEAEAEAGRRLEQAVIEAEGLLTDGERETREKEWRRRQNH